MSIQIDINDEIVTSMRIPLPEVKRELVKELSFALYSRWALSIGRARQMAGLTKREFLNELASRKIMRHYTKENLSEDMAYAQSSK